MTAAHEPFSKINPEAKKIFDLMREEKCCLPDHCIRNFEGKIPKVLGATKMCTIQQTERHIEAIKIKIEALKQQLQDGQGDAEITNEITQDLENYTAEAERYEGELEKQREMPDDESDARIEECLQASSEDNRGNSIGLWYVNASFDPNATKSYIETMTTLVSSRYRYALKKAREGAVPSHTVYANDMSKLLNINVGKKVDKVSVVTKRPWDDVGDQMSPLKRLKTDHA